MYALRRSKSRQREQDRTPVQAHGLGGRVSEWRCVLPSRMSVQDFEFGVVFFFDMVRHCSTLLDMEGWGRARSSASLEQFRASSAKSGLANKGSLQPEVGSFSSCGILKPSRRIMRRVAAFLIQEDRLDESNQDSRSFAPRSTYPCLAQAFFSDCLEGSKGWSEIRLRHLSESNSAKAWFRFNENLLFPSSEMSKA